ncbi:MAG: hypothetical protein V4492_07770 [Chlamydiota bacterium]
MELDLVGVGSGGVAVLDIHPIRPSIIDRVYAALKILFTDLLPGIFSSNLPNALTWVYRTWCTRTLTCHTLVTQAGGAAKAARLFSHGKVDPRPGGDLPALLLLHGDQSHPFTLLHLADIAQEQGRAVFSVHLPYDDEHPERHRSLLSQSIDKIDQIIGARGGKLSNLVLAGHSRGAMEAANEAFAVNNPKVSGVIAIAGRFKVISPSARPCRPSLEASVNALWEKIGHWNQSLRVPFYQIAAKKDWCMDPEASIVRTDHEHLYVDAGHLGVINHPSTLNQFRVWLAKF